MNPLSPQMEHKLGEVKSSPPHFQCSGSQMFLQMWPWPHSNWQAWHQLGFISEVVGGQAGQPYHRSLDYWTTWSSCHPPLDVPTPCLSKNLL